MRPNRNTARHLNFVNDNVRAEIFILCVSSTQKNSVEGKIQIIVLLYNIMQVPETTGCDNTPTFSVTVHRSTARR
jgi:uncharacterized protein (DUF736 family)